MDNLIEYKSSVFICFIFSILVNDIIHRSYLKTQNIKPLKIYSIFTLFNIGTLLILKIWYNVTMWNMLGRLELMLILSSFTFNFILILLKEIYNILYNQIKIEHIIIFWIFVILYAILILIIKTIIMFFISNPIQIKYLLDMYMLNE